MKKCKKCKNDVEYEEFDLCKNCYVKWKEKALKCKNCKQSIDWHNSIWHDRLCDECEDKLLSNLK